MGLLGLGAGTVPRIIDAHYPCGNRLGGPATATGPDNHSDDDVARSRFVIHGWELDPGVVMAARLHLGMQRLEDKGALVAYTGDALSPSASLPGGFCGVIVDLFAGGRLLPQLTKRSTWEDIRSRLAAPRPSRTSDAAPALIPRVIANLGQSPPAAPGMRWQDEAYTTLRAYEAMESAFAGEVSLLRCQDNILALTGPLPGSDEWPGGLPGALRKAAEEQGCWARDMYPLQTHNVPLSLW